MATDARNVTPTWKSYNCSWPFIQHSRWKMPINLGTDNFDSSADSNSTIQDDILSGTFLIAFGLTILLLHLVGRYSTRRKYYEPLASEVKAYSAEMGSTVQKTALDRAVFDCQEVPDFAASIVLAMLDPLSFSYSFDVALHDYGRFFVPTFVTLLLTRGMYYTIAYHVFTYCSRESFSCLTDFLYRRYNSLGLANLSSALMLASELCQLVLLFNQTAREMKNIVGCSFQFWLFCLAGVTFFMAQCGAGSLVKISVTIYCGCIFTYFWMCLQLRFMFTRTEPNGNYPAWRLKSYETRKEQALSVPDTLLYESNLICIVLAAPLLHTAARLNQTEYTVYQSLSRRFRRKRVFVRAFFINLCLNLCHKAVLRSLFALRIKEGCDPVLAGTSCHFAILSNALQSHASMKALYVSLIFYKACWLGGVKVVSSAHMATRSRMMRSFVELCLVGQRWADMNRWRRQNGLILFRGCRLIDLQSYVYKTFIVALIGSLLLYCLDNLPQDASVLKVQFANYLVLDLRFMVCLNATLIGLAFRRLSRSGICWILAVSILLYAYQLLWGDRLTGDQIRFMLMTPLFKSHAAWLRRNCSRRVRLRPVVNVGKRIVDHEVVHLVDSDAFYPTILGLTWCLAAIAGCLFSSQLAVLKSPYYSIGDAVSVNIARSIRSGLMDRTIHLISAARTSLQSVRWRGGQKRACSSCPSRCLCCACCRKASAAPVAPPAEQRQQQQPQQPPLVQPDELNTMSIASQLVRDKYTTEETELILSSLTEAGLRQRLIDGDRKSRFSINSE